MIQDQPPTTFSPTAELILFVGLPASGKSTFYRERLAETHVLVSKDLMPRSANKARRQKQLLEAALGEGRPVVLDNTNVSRHERAAAIEVAKALGVPVKVYCFETSIDECRNRNSAREAPARVPLVALYAAAKRYEEPALEEGVSEIHTVQLGQVGFVLDT